MARHFKVDDTLTPEHRNELLTLAAVQPSTTVDQLHAWTRQHGYFISRTAVWKWHRNLRELSASPIDQIVRLLRGHGARFSKDSLNRILEEVHAGIAEGG